jgi:hypothetical protein
LINQHEPKGKGKTLVFAWKFFALNKSSKGFEKGDMLIVMKVLSTINVGECHSPF